MEALAGELGAHPFALDATDMAQVGACVGTAQGYFERLDGVVNCVGSLVLKPAHSTTDEEWQQTIAIDLTTAFAAVRAGAKAMMQSRGDIVLVASAAAQAGLVNHETTAACAA